MEALYNALQGFLWTLRPCCHDSRSDVCFYFSTNTWINACLHVLTLTASVSCGVEMYIIVLLFSAGVPQWDHYRDFPFRDNEVVHIGSWKNSTVHLKYSVSSKKHSESTLFQLEPSHKVKDRRQKERRGRLEGVEGAGGVWRDGLVLRTEHRWFSRWKTVRLQLAGVLEKTWIICHLVQQRSPGGHTAHVGRHGGSRGQTQVRFRLYLSHDLD